MIAKIINTFNYQSRCIDKHHIISCLQLVKLINDEEDWPAMASEWNEFIHIVSFFTEFSTFFIARKRNVRADLLAKGARLQNSIFSHVNSEILG